jgi:hypothetical protein
LQDIEMFVYICSQQTTTIKINIMKKTVLLLAAVLGLASCSKQGEPVPVNVPLESVTYTVNCEHCVVYYEDNNFNRNNGVPDRGNQYVVVSGSFSTTVNKPKIDTASMKIYTSVFSPAQNVKATIKTNNGKAEVLEKVFSIDDNYGIVELDLRD